MSDLTRRNFLGTTAAATATIVWNNPLFAATTPDPDGPWDMVAVRNGEADTMYHAGIAALGGMKSFVKSGQTVVVKPNIAWDKPPEIPANTNPDLVRAIVKDCLAAGAAKVIVFDHTCHNWQKSYPNSGIEQAVKDAGGEMAPANLESHYREVELKGAKTVTKALVHKHLLDCDVLINVPILKHHGGAKLSLCMKNLMGVVWDRRFFHKNGLDQGIADLCFLPKKPDLNIIDAYRILRKNGPQGRAPEDGELTKYQMIGTDMVALDAAAAKLFGLAQEKVGYIGIANQMGAGQSDLSKVKIKRVTL
ncbi:MAG: DUF362 domain-containing protein [Verrucomicrobiales bacterium]|nr:DUF362 domain-containing protein [Verrucomicrobiota bacterium JB025]